MMIGKKNIFLVGCLVCAGLSALLLAVWLGIVYLFAYGQGVAVPIAIGQSGDRVITFYGKVVDQDGKGVPHAVVKAKYSQFNTEEYLQGHAYTPIPLEATTDADGNFRFRSLRVNSLTFLDVQASGYTYRQDLYPIFDYDPSTTRKVHVPDPAAPELFTMWRYKGACERLRPWSAFARPIADDGGPWGLYLRNPALMDKDIKNPDLVFHVEHDYAVDPRDWNTVRGRYDWSLVIEVPDGGIIETKDYYMYEAPKSGYAPRFEFKVAAGDPDWNEEKNLQFYVRSRAGKYVTAMKVTARIRRVTYHIDVEARGYTNLNGSHNLQVDPSNVEPLGGK